MRGCTALISKHLYQRFLANERLALRWSVARTLKSDSFCHGIGPLSVSWQGEVELVRKTQAAVIVEVQRCCSPKASDRSRRAGGPTGPSKATGGAGGSPCSSCFG